MNNTFDQVKWKEKHLLVDGQGLLKQSFHASQNLFDKHFGYIGALVTFYSILRKVIKEQQVTKVILFWDSVSSGKLRHDIYPLYKSNRGHKSYNDSELILTEKDILKEENADRSLLQQRERIKQYAEEFFFRQVEDPLCEADDCIAYYINNILKRNELAIIYTNDRDFCQLLSTNVHIYLANKKTIINQNNYWQFFNHDVTNSALVKAIIGCDSDVILGVQGLAEKGLLKYFPELRTHKCSFEHILVRAEEINKGRKKPIEALKNLLEGVTSQKIDNIFNGRDLLKLNYKLVNLKEPFMTDECIELIEENVFSPLSDEDRGGKNILRLMMEDGFINQVPGGKEGYINFLTDFMPVVNKEKEVYQKYLKNL